MINLNDILIKMGSQINELIAVAVVGRDDLTVAEYSPSGIDREHVYAQFSMVLTGVEESVNSLSELGRVEDKLVFIQTDKAKILIKFLGPRFFLILEVKRSCNMNSVLAIIKKLHQQLRKAL